ncbi:MAG: hypothetical protein WDZ94_03145 [Patescibacteria group bacterium]
MQPQLPTHVQKYFWGDNLEELSWDQHKKYIVQTLLDKGDMQSLNWLFQHISRAEIKRFLPTLKLQPKSSNFWQIYLS